MSGVVVPVVIFLWPLVLLALVLLMGAIEDWLVRRVSTDEITSLMRRGGPEEVETFVAQHWRRRFARP